MRWWSVLMGGILLVACTPKPPPLRPPSEPPPRGQPSPRNSDIPMPPPGRTQETWEDHEQRFPILEGEERKEAKKRAQIPVSARVEVRPSLSALACEGLTAEEKIECPLHDPKVVASIKDLPRGVRVTLRPGAPSPERLQQLFACQKGLAVVRPKAPTACTFFDARTDAEVSVREEHVVVDIERSGDVVPLRNQVRTALGGKLSP